MKNKVRLIGAGLLALLLTLTGCFTPLNDPADTAAGESSGTKIVVEVGGLDARTLAPTDLTGVKYAVTIRQQYPDTTVIDAEDVNFSEPQEYPLEPGTYTVYVWAYTGEYKGSAWGSTDVTLENGKTERLKINLAPLTGEDVPGTFSYSVVYPADLEYSEAKLKLEPTNPNSGSVDVDFRNGGAAAASLQLPPGKYTLTVTLKSNRQISSNEKGILQAAAKETVYIYPNLTTLGEFTFTEADFSAEVYFSGTARVVIGGQDYVPQKVQIKLYDGEDDEDYDDANVREADITHDAATGDYVWELLVPSNEINPRRVENARFRFTVKSKSGEKELTGPWDTQPVTSIQGVSGINLTASIYQISAVNGGAITGVSGVAGNTDAIGGTEVRVKLASSTANYGVIGSTLSVDGVNIDKEPDGTLAFTMPAQNVTVNGNFFHLSGAGFPTIEGSTEEKNKYTKGAIEAIEKTSDGTLRVIARTVPLISLPAESTAWSIPIPKSYVTDPFTPGEIYFKIILSGTNVASYEVTNSSWGYATGYIETDSQVYLSSVNLDNVPNIRAEAASTMSIKLTWDAAPWAKGYNVYNSELAKINPVLITNTTYTVEKLTEGTSYTFYVAGVRSNDSEGNKTSVYEMTKLAPPQNVTATTNPGYFLQIRVLWDKVATAWEYDIYRGEDLIATIPGSRDYYDDSDVEIDTAYTYQIVARNINYANTDSARSTATAQTAITTESFSLNDWKNGQNIAAGTIKYYRLTIPESRQYYIQAYNYSNAYFYLYVNGDYQRASNNLELTPWLSVGDEVIVAVKGQDENVPFSYQFTVYPW